VSDSRPLENLWTAKKRLSKAEEAVAFEQYKMYVQLADHISDRRDKANNFFLSLNTGVITAVGFLWDKHTVIQPKELIVFPLGALLAFCYFWHRLVKSYRQLTTQKFILIGAVEERLPVRFWSTEWKLLGEGKDTKKYSPLSELEEKVPIVFGAIYIGIAVITWFWS
jgi:hypothetical protein